MINSSNLESFRSLPTKRNMSGGLLLRLSNLLIWPGYDLSKNDKLDSLLFDGVDISNLKVTPNTMRLLSLKHGIYTNASLNNIQQAHRYREFRRSR